MDKKSMSEQDIRTNYITPAIQGVGWKGRRLREEVYFTAGLGEDPKGFRQKNEDSGNRLCRRLNAAPANARNL